jgi:hypothetical protein
LAIFFQGESYFDKKGWVTFSATFFTNTSGHPKPIYLCIGALLSRRPPNCRTVRCRPFIVRVFRYNEMKTIKMNQTSVGTLQ